MTVTAFSCPPECDLCRRKAQCRCIDCDKKLCRSHAYLVDVIKAKCKSCYQEKPSA